MNAIHACMGGWCAKRDHCAHYHAGSESQQPAERLCPPGQDGAGLQQLQEIDVTATRRTVERVFAVVTLVGKSVADIAAEAGIHPANVRSALAELSKEHRVWTCRINTRGAKKHLLMAYSTESARDVALQQARDVTRAKQRAFQAAYKAKVRAVKSPEVLSRKLLAEKKKRDAEEARKLEAERHAQARLIRAAEAEQAKLRARLAREAQAAEKHREKVEAKTQRERLRAETKAASQLAKTKGTSSPKAAPTRGPAMLPGAPIIPAGVTIQKLGNRLNEHLPKVQGGFSSLPPGVYVLPPSSCAARAAGGGV